MPHLLGGRFIVVFRTAKVTPQGLILLLIVFRTAKISRFLAVQNTTNSPVCANIPDITVQSALTASPVGFPYRASHNQLKYPTSPRGSFVVLGHPETFGWSIFLVEGGHGILPAKVLGEAYASAAGL